jgi:hypothetical protein
MELVEFMHMRLRLEHVDVRGLKLELSREPESGGDERVIVRSATALRGLVEQGSERLKLAGVEADEVELEALRLVFGSVVLEQERSATLTRLRVELDQSHEGTALDLYGDVLAERLAVEIGSIRIEGLARIEGLRVRVRGDHGCIEAEQLSVSGLSTKVGAVGIGGDEVVVHRLVIAWGEEFRLEASGVEAPALQVGAAQTQIEASAVAVRELSIHGARVSLGEAKLGGAAIASDFTPTTSEDRREQAAPATASKSASQPFDWGLLDGLHGDLDVDLSVDLTVPVIGRRRATHHFRIPIESGALDFIRLENDLSTLENTLLDFAVRDGALVLERGIPLLPTRGRGKPIIIWKLEDEDLQLAAKQRVRLAVLPGARLAAQPQPSANETKSERAKAPSVALRRLGLRNISARLGLASDSETTQGLLARLRFERLAMRGDVHHDPEGEPRPGRIEGELAELETKVLGLPIGLNRLHADVVRLGQVSELAVSFEGLRPSALHVALSGLSLVKAELRES